MMNGTTELLRNCLYTLIFPHIDHNHEIVFTTCASAIKRPSSIENLQLENGQMFLKSFFYLYLKISETSFLGVICFNSPDW